MIVNAGICLIIEVEKTKFYSLRTILQLLSLIHIYMYKTSLGIPFRVMKECNNIAYTSLWDNYPDMVKVPLSGKASHAYLLLVGSTNHMQCRIANGIVRVYYTDGTSEVLELVNPCLLYKSQTDGICICQSGCQWRVHIGRTD